MRKIATWLLTIGLCFTSLQVKQPTMIYASSEKETYREGYDAGYAYEMKQASTKFSATTGKAEYKRGYEDGWYDAYDKLVDTALTLAIDNAEADYETGKKTHRTPPTDLKFKSMYREAYTKAYEDLDKYHKSDIEELADENAKKDCFNLLSRNSELASIPSTKRLKYSDTYKAAYSRYSKDITQAKKDAKTNGKKDGKEGLPQNLTAYKEFKGYAVYSEIVDIYNEAFLAAGGTISEQTKTDYVWVKKDGTWYVEDKLGAPCSNQWVFSFNEWYYTEGNGKIHLGWLAKGNVWYYFDGSGKMVTTSQLINNKLEKFNKNGAWISE